ncbi:caspase family protein [Actinomycetospora sp.]|uniref:caspase family protein n=1 Tax=Actinomycetospora sp. TaxID=1872135 RepID=UPI002F3FCDEE
MSTLPPEVIARLRPHVINLNQGRLSSGGTYATSDADIQEIFRTHLPAWLETAASPSVVFWAHGGLVDESEGLGSAADQIPFWLDNGVYPIFFVWESGLFDTLGQLLGRHEDVRALSRDFWDLTIDPLVEATARALGGPKVWSAMKTSAEYASRDDGGATRTAVLLKELCDSRRDLELHAVGHSAGAIFHRYFLARAQTVEVPPFRSLSLLAPAITIETFKDGLISLIGAYIESLTMYTMHREFELDDVCSAGGVDFYHKSLLYLINRALEPQPETPILGLEDSVNADAGLSELFRPGSAEPAKIVWSVTPGESSSTSHGGFDNDPDTMNSLVRAIRGVAQPSSPYVAATRAVSTDRRPPLLVAGSASARPAKRALCIGIDAYPAPNSLGGCVADAHEWAEVLRQRGFEVATLVDQQATRQQMLDGIRRLVAATGPGDIGVLQYSGHGTQVPDADGDETTDHLDEAIVPIDFGDGAFIIDDDLRAVFSAVPAGGNLTCFMDCCYSESNTRMLRVERPRVETGAASVRYLSRSADRDRSHRQYRRTHRSRVTARPATGAVPMTNVSFSACRDFQVALESDGHGHFTTAATRLLRDPDASAWTNVEFLQHILGTIETGQTPTLEPAGDSRRLLTAYEPAGLL